MGFKNSKEKQDALECVFYEIQMFIESFKLVTSYSCCQLMKNMILESWLLHARILLFTFENADSDKDDILGAAFGFAAKPIATPGLDRKRLHKDLAHLTLDRLTRKDKPEKAWQFKWFTPILDRINEFLGHIIGDSEVTAKQKAEAESYRSSITNLLKSLGPSGPVAGPDGSKGATGLAG